MIDSASYTLYHTSSDLVSHSAPHPRIIPTLSGGLTSDQRPATTDHRPPDRPSPSHDPPVSHRILKLPCYPDYTFSTFPQLGERGLRAACGLRLAGHTELCIPAMPTLPFSILILPLRASPTGPSRETPPPPPKYRYRVVRVRVCLSAYLSAFSHCLGLLSSTVQSIPAVPS